MKKIEKIKGKKIRKGILSLEKEMSNLPGAEFGDNVGTLKHTFADGLYIREVSVPKDMLIVTKLHKKSHPYFLLKGECSVLTEEGVIRIKAPFSGITKPGTKRVVYVHEDTIWTTVHATKKTDLKMIEEEVIAKDFSELPRETIEKFLKEATK